MEKEVVYRDLSYKIVGILFSVHNELGRFRSEKQYADAIEKCLQESGLTYEREKAALPSFEGEQAGHNKLDFLIEDKVVLELKAKRVLNREDYLQLMRYLKSADKRLGILANFHQKYLTPKRILNG